MVSQGFLSWRFSGVFVVSSWCLSVSWCSGCVWWCLRGTSMVYWLCLSGVLVFQWPRKSGCLAHGCGGFGTSWRCSSFFQISVGEKQYFRDILAVSHSCLEWCPVGVQVVSRWCLVVSSRLSWLTCQYQTGIARNAKPCYWGYILVICWMNFGCCWCCTFFFRS